MHVHDLSVGEWIALGGLIFTAVTIAIAVIAGFWKLAWLLSAILSEMKGVKTQVNKNGKLLEDHGAACDPHRARLEERTEGHGDRLDKLEGAT